MNAAGTITAGPARRPRRRLVRRAVGFVRWILMAGCVGLIGLSIAGMLARFQVVAVTSGSMRPGIEPGDALLVRELGDKGVRTGDIVVFSTATSKAFVAHRVVEIRDSGGGKYYRMKGDANKTTDANLVPGKSVLGRVLLRVPKVGRQLFWFSKVGIKLSLAALFGLIFLEEVAVLIPYLRRRKRRRAGAQAGRR